MSVEFVAVGGADEIGMNMYLYGRRAAGGKRQWIAVDCGVAFGDPESTPGVETLVPDPRFLRRPEEEVAAIFLTHGHEDHVGAIGELWPQLGRPPVYATGFASEVARRKMEEAGFAGQVTEAEAGQKLRAAGFEIEYYPVVHSIPEAMLLAIRSPEGTIVHSGDFRAAAAGDLEAAALRRLGDEGVICLACESTNIFEPGEDLTEEDLLPRLEEAIEGCEGAVAATTFSSNVQRMRTLAQAAATCGRETVVVGRSMLRMLEAARAAGCDGGFPPWQEKPSPGRRREEVFYLVTGSQGEPRSALSRAARNDHRDLQLAAGDTVIYSSSVVPGNEIHVHRVHNELARMGVRVVDGESNGLHVSGHAGYRELGKLYELLRPAAAIPIHGEPRHLLEHAARAREWGAKDAEIVRNGIIVEIDGQGLRRGDEIDCGRMYRDGKLLVAEGKGVVMSRRRMQNAGHVTVGLMVDEDGDLTAEPKVSMRGMPWIDESENALAVRIVEDVESAVGQMAGRLRPGSEALERAVVRTVRRAARDMWGKQPEVTVLAQSMADRW